MKNYLDQFQLDAQKALDNFKKEIASLKTGRVTPALVENILIESYGQKMPLIQLASINAAGSRTIIIQPWDKNITKEIAKALSQSNLGVMPNISENIIRLNFPPPTEESRKEIVKILHQKLEDSRVNLRKIRENIRELIITAEKNKEISEDEKFKKLAELDDEIKKKNDELKNLSDKKEKEILTI